MKTPDEIEKGLECCIFTNAPCTSCPFRTGTGAECIPHMSECALAYIQQLENHVDQLETRGWELFALLSSAWYGKDCYFKQDDGTVYSRASCQYLSFDQATDEFATALTNAYEVSHE